MRQICQACAMTMGNFLYLSSVWARMVMSFFIASSFLCSHGQPDSLGFITIDCGYTTSNYTDQKTGLTFVADVGFTDAGLIHTVDMPDLGRRYLTVRFFPNGTRSCYKLRSLTPGGKNSVRAIFVYWNYDGLNRTPAFDLYLGVNYWTTVNITDGHREYIFETIAVSPAEYLHVCLVNIGLGTPFISGLDLRPLPANLYPEANVTQSLVLLSFFRDKVDYGFNRYHFGTNGSHIRFPDDGYDRIWQRYEDNPNWRNISDEVNGTVQNSPNDNYNAPSDVMRSASTPVNASRMDLSWSSDASMNVGVDTKYFVVLYFAEVEAIPDNALRQFHVIVDDTTLASAFSPQYMLSTVLSGTVQGPGQHNISLRATQASKLPPLISAMEIYLVRPLNESSTDAKLDVILGSVAAIIVLLLLVALLALVIWNRRRKRKDVPLVSNPYENRRFKYKDLKAITNGFKKVIGKGGYGPVYIGCLEDGTAVAVKVESQTSAQGNNEFLAEVHHLTRVHHNNLVRLIGYCEDRKHRCLVYEFMDGGNLEDRLRGQEEKKEDAPIEPLTWLQRLNIALGSASGLEYLHKSCSPPLIHRDIKTRNILLNANLVAKISDFGLTRAFSSETGTHTTTVPGGTPGYVDPEYYDTFRLSEKSDVYSFGVVLLVLITAQPAIIPINYSERESIVHWVRERLSQGDIERVTDQRIREDCDVNSVWKVAELALHCTERLGRDRPTMTEVVDGLRESLQLELSSRSMRRGLIGTRVSASADAQPVGVLGAEQIREISAR